MRPRVTLLALAAVLGLGFAAGRLDSQEGMDPARLQELMQKMMEATQPGDEHAWLEELEGEWDVTYTMRQGPEMPATKATGTMTAEMILGGRWLKQESKGPLGESLGMIGFDRRHGDFVVVGFDANSTYSVSGRGKKDEQTGLVVMHGEDQEIAGKQVFRFEWNVVSEDEQSVAIIFTELGPMKFPEGFEAVRMDLKRRK